LAERLQASPAPAGARVAETLEFCEFMQNELRLMR
jgi:hypothetical protein